MFEDNMPVKQPPGNMLHIVIILLAVNLIGLILGKSSSFFMSLMDFFTVSTAESQVIFFFIASIVQAALFIGLSIYFAAQKAGNPYGSLGLSIDNLKKNISLGIVGGIGLFSLVVGTGIIVSIFFPIEVEPQPFAQLLMDAEGTILTMLLVVMGSVLAPLGEEIFFRGFVYSILRHRLGIKFGIILSSIIFAGLHFDFIRLIPIAVGGIGLAILYERSGSLITPIIAHSVWNSIMTMMIIFVGIT
ncbi:MAG: type II CAAX endopeptidase family protein [Bacillota bacterium]|nr:type II CAAX endopeptidase family protein [Bacillota bacterium]